MELRLLRYFLMVAKEENITQAAKKLYITQPTLSKQIQQLEEELGTQLLTRGARKVVLTEAGLLLQSRAESILEMVEHSKSELQEHATDISGQIRIGIPESQAGQMLIRLLSDFQKKYPKVTFDIFTGTAETIMDRIDIGLIDLGLLMGINASDRFNYISLEQLEEWGILCPFDSELSIKEAVEPDDIRDKSILLPKRFLDDPAIIKWFNCNIEQLNIVGTFNMTTNAVLMSENNMGYAFVIRGSFLGETEHGVRFISLSPKVFSDSVLVWKKYQVFGPTITKLIEFVHQSIGTKIS